MDGQVRIYLWTAIVVVMVAVALVHMWPYRQYREIVVRRRIAAPRERIWDTYFTNPDNALSAAFHDTLVSSRTVSNDPEIIEFVTDASGRHGTHHSAVQLETLVSERPERTAVRRVRIDDQPPPEGEDNIEDMQLVDGPGGTMATLTWRGQTQTFGQYRERRNHLNQYMNSLKTFCESGQGTSVPRATQSTLKCIGLTALAIGSFTFLFGWILAFILSLAIVFHEFGHWLAMRMTGQPKPLITLVPFLGGVAVPNHPHKTQFDSAVVALAGAGLSILPCLALLGGGIALGVPDLVKSAKVSMAGEAGISPGRVLLSIAYLIAILNGLQLLPVLPLDGGQVVRSVIESAGARRARAILLGLACAGVVCFGLLEDYILAAILVLGAMQAWHLGEAKTTARPMGRTGLAIIGISYGLVFGIHAGIIAYAMQMLGYEFL